LQAKILQLKKSWKLGHGAVTSRAALHKDRSTAHPGNDQQDVQNKRYPNETIAGNSLSRMRSPIT
jgi:hypothetical protein